jgi:Fe2+ or Zn2+ uptake regulation protein
MGDIEPAVRKTTAREAVEQFLKENTSAASPVASKRVVRHVHERDDVDAKRTSIRQALSDMHRHGVVQSTPLINGRKLYWLPGDSDE